ASCCDWGNGASPYLSHATHDWILPMALATDDRIRVTEPARTFLTPPTTGSCLMALATDDRIRVTEPARTFLTPPTTGTGPADPATKETIVSLTINWAQCHTRPVLMIPGP